MKASAGKTSWKNSGRTWITLIARRFRVLLRDSGNSGTAIRRDNYAGEDSKLPRIHIN